MAASWPVLTCRPCIGSHITHHHKPHTPPTHLVYLTVRAIADNFDQFKYSSWILWIRRVRVLNADKIVDVRTCMPRNLWSRVNGINLTQYSEIKLSAISTHPYTVVTLLDHCSQESKHTITRHSCDSSSPRTHTSTRVYKHCTIDLTGEGVLSVWVMECKWLNLINCKIFTCTQGSS